MPVAALSVPVIALYAGSLALLLLAELNHANPTLPHGCGIALAVARVLHAVGLGRSARTSW
jgi:uncharacterized membrane protein YecN with MAPEG domain